jgi:hypothetical protein
LKHLRYPERSDKPISAAISNAPKICMCSITKSVVLLALAVNVLTAAALGIPVKVWFDFYVPGCPTNTGNDIAAAIAKTLQDSVNPYEFRVASSERAANIRIALKPTDPNTIKLTGKLHGYSRTSGDPVGLGEPEDWATSFPVPPEGVPCDAWQQKTLDVLTKQESLLKLKGDLSRLMPFAKGIDLLHPPPPHAVEDTQILILFPLNTQYAGGALFEIEYDDDRRLRGVGRECTADTPSRVIVQPETVLLHGKREDLTTHFADFVSIYRDRKEELIFPGPDFSPGIPPRSCKSTNTLGDSLRPRQISRGPRGAP